MKTFSYVSKGLKPKNWKVKSLLKRFFSKAPLGTWLFRAATIFVVLVALLFLYYSFTLPSPNKLLERNVVESTKIFDRNGELLYEVHGEAKRTLIELDQISTFAKQATIAIEDKDFYKHGGFSLTGLFRAGVYDVLFGQKQGGSTITQQFVKNALLTSEKRLSRKVKELILSVEIEARYSKDDILKLYLNEIPYGRNAYGIEAASQTYFGKSAKDLTLSESAYLAALPQAPSRYSPFGPGRELLDARHRRVLDAMQSEGYITEEQKQAALAETVTFRTAKTAINAPHFVLYVEDLLADKYGESRLREGGLKVYTTLDSKLQKAAESAITSFAERNSKQYDAHNAALVAVDPKTGQILAMVGSKDYFGTAYPEGCTSGKDCLFEPNFNASLAERQPGSSFKPYAYLTAFEPEHGFSPASMLLDVTTNFGTFGDKSYVPNNYNFKNYGPLSARQALAGSLNIPAVKILSLVGPDNVVNKARELGITSPMRDCGLALVLGGCEVRLLDHVSAFSVFGNEGVRNPATAIMKIEDRDGKILEEFKADSKRVADEQAIYELTSVLSDRNARSFIFGAGNSLVVPGHTVAVKTGTTQSWRDGWTVGTTPQIAAGVWVGNSSGKFMKQGADGSLVASPIWKQFMTEALKDLPNEEFHRPEKIKTVTVDSLTGLLPSDFSPSTKEEIFADYAVPQQTDNVHVTVAIDITTGLPATNLTPENQILYKTYTELHSERPDNPAWEEPVRAWAEANGYPYPPGDSILPPPTSGNSEDAPEVTIVSPVDGSSITKTPFTVTTAVTGQAPIVRVEAFLDGSLFASKNSSPYNFGFTGNLSPGLHILAVRATDQLGRSSGSTVQFTYSENTSLTLVAPQSGDTVSWPQDFVAESEQSFALVTFYAEVGGQTIVLGSSTATTFGNTRTYHITVDNPPDSGKAQVYARSNTGAQSKKNPVTFP